MSNFRFYNIWGELDMNKQFSMNRTDLRRLEKAAREKDKKYLLEWAVYFESCIRADLESDIRAELTDSIDVFCLAIAYTLHFSETTLLDKKDLPDFMIDFYTTVDMFKRGEYSPLDYKSELESDGVFFDEIQYSKVSKFIEEYKELKDIEKKYNELIKGERLNGENEN